MTHRFQMIPLSKLLLDESNARLGTEQSNQQDTQIALAGIVGPQLLEMAQDILTYGTDPTALLIVTPERAPSGKYRVLEGNRRVLVLKALKKPAIIQAALSPAMRKRLEKMSETFLEEPINSLRCVVYDTEEEKARHWIELRHTGENSGVGLVEWDANDKDRYKSRHGGVRSPQGQIIDFVDKIDPPRPGDNTKIYTTIERLISNKIVKDALGIAVDSGLVYSYYPGPEVFKGLSAIVRDLRSGLINVTHVYYKDQQTAHIGKFPTNKLPDPSTKLRSRIELRLISPDSRSDKSSVIDQEPQIDAPKEAENLGEEYFPEAHDDIDSAPSSESNDEREEEPPSDSTAPTSPGSPRSRVKLPRIRSTLIPGDCSLWITQPRINSIYRELLKLDVDQFTNACAVSLRVFVELSVDHHILVNSLISEEQCRNTTLAKKLKELANHLHGTGRITEKLEKTIIKIVDGKGMFSASTTAFNQYVHNEFAYPQPTELRTAWDELQPFMMAVWIK